jgi:hypothetical protein
MWSRNMNKVVENIIFKILALTSLMQVKSVCLYSLHNGTLTILVCAFAHHI